MLKSLDQDQDQHFVGPDLGPKLFAKFISRRKKLLLLSKRKSNQGLLFLVICCLFSKGTFFNNFLRETISECLFCRTSSGSKLIAKVTSRQLDNIHRVNPLYLHHVLNGYSLQWHSQNAEKVTHIKGRLLHQAMILDNCVPFTMGTSLKRKNLLPEGANSFLLDRFFKVWKITFTTLGQLP